MEALAINQSRAPILVQKYGGSSVSDLNKIQNVAQNIKASLARYPRIVVVVSAMGSYTDELLDLAYQLNPMPPKRELDMLVTTGERISTALLGIALAKLGIVARSLTGSQSGILTDEIHGNARIFDIRPERILHFLQAEGVVIVAGFQGVSPRTKDITSLGRGGSDLSAIALTAALNASLCEIYTDVCGVMTADPRVVAEAQTIKRIPWALMCELAWAGAGVLHHRGSYLAAKYKIPLRILSTHGDLSKTTEIEGEKSMESPRVVSIATKKHMTLARIRCGTNPQVVGAECLNWLWTQEISPTVFEWQYGIDDWTLVCLMEGHEMENFISAFKASLSIQDVQTQANLSLITLVGQGFRQSPELATKLLSQLPVNISYFSYQDSLITLAVQSTDLENAVKLLHEKFFS